MHAFVALLLVVKVFDRSGQSLPDRKAAVRTADAILQQADVTTHWVDCSTNAAVASPRCDTPLAPGELAMRITPGPPDQQAQPTRSLGYSMVEPQHNSGTLGTVFSDRVEWLADAARTNRQTLLGRAIAHEIGHLVIGTNTHSSSGLMRPVWTTKALQQNRPEDWVFNSADVRRLHRSRLDDDGGRLAKGGGSDARPADDLLVVTFDGS